MSDQLQLPMLMEQMTAYDRLNTSDKQLIAVAYDHEPNLALLNYPDTPVRHLKDFEKDRTMKARKVELQASVDRLLQSGWMVRTMTGSVALTKAGRKAYEQAMEDQRRLGTAWICGR